MVYIPWNENVTIITYDLLNHIKFWSNNLKGTDHSEVLGVDGKVILDLGETGWAVVDWIHLAQDAVP
jgi:hypothetical protein